MPLTKVKAGHTAKVKRVKANDKTKRFLFTLGCSEGEEITLVSVLAGNYIIGVKDSRYAIDRRMAKAIELV
jgi:ferrous iron transport protein A